MRLAVAEREVDVVGLGEGTAFRVEATAKTFKVLSSNLYRDKIAAVVREIATNARDEHIKMGKPDVPFRVHLPNAIEPYFSIRDFGPGIAPADMKSVYAVYFHSTKTHSNRYTGALGLGSKSPFAYTQSFTVASYQQGVARTYVVYINKDGVPTFDLMQETETTEPDGLEVTVPVARPSDFETFASRASEIYSRFEPRPEISGKKDFVFAERKVIVEGKGWRFCEGNGGALAVMGPVAYRITPDDISGGLPDHLANLLRAQIEIDFPMGALDFSPGREDLSYDPQTSEALIARAKMVHGDIVKRTQVQHFDAAKTLLEAHGVWSRLFCHDHGAKDERTLSKLVAGATFLFRKQPINTHMIRVPLAKDYSDAHIILYDDPSRKHHFKTFARRQSIDQFGNVRITEPDELCFPVHHDTKVIVLFNDVVRPGGRVRLRRKEQPDETLIIFTGNEERYRDFLTKLDGAISGKTSDLPKPTRQNLSPLGAGAGTGERIKRIYMLSNTRVPNAVEYYWKTSFGWIAEAAENHPDARFYIPLTTGRRPTDTVPGNLGRLMVAALHLNILPEPIYGLTPIPTRKAVQADSGWSTVWDEIRRRADQLYADPKVISGVENEGRLLQLGKRYPHMMNMRSLLTKLAAQLEADHPLVAFMEDVALAQVHPKARQLRELADLLNITLPTMSSDLVARWAALAARYPLIETLVELNSLHEKLIAHCADYIMMIDKRKRRR